MTDGDDSDFFVTFDGKLVLPPHVQRDVDAVVGAFRRGEASDDAFERLAAWLDDYADGALLQYELSFQALASDTVRDAFAALDDEDVAEHLGLDDATSLTDADRVAHLEEHEFGRLFEDGDVAPGFTPVPLRATGGAEAVLIRRAQGYSFSGVTFEWLGPYESFEAFVHALAADGWVVDVEEFGARPLQDKLRLLRGAPPDHAG